MADVATMEKPAEGDEPQKAPTTEEIIKQVTESVTAKLSEDFETKYKAEIAGLNRRISEEQKAKDELEKASNAEKLTVEEQLAAVRADREADKREAEAEKVAATLREKQLAWKAASVKRGLLDSTYVDPGLSLEDGEAYLDQLKADNDAKMTAAINEKLAGGYKPGASSEDTKGEKPDSELTEAEAIDRAQKRIDAQRETPIAFKSDGTFKI